MEPSVLAIVSSGYSNDLKSSAFAASSTGNDNQNPEAWPSYVEAMGNDLLPWLT